MFPIWKKHFLALCQYKGFAKIDPKIFYFLGSNRWIFRGRGTQPSFTLLHMWMTASHYCIFFTNLSNCYVWDDIYRISSYIRPGPYYKAHRHLKNSENLHYIRPTISNLFKGHPFVYKTNVSPHCYFSVTRISWALIWEKHGPPWSAMWPLLELQKTQKNWVICGLGLVSVKLGLALYQIKVPGFICEVIR